MTPEVEAAWEALDDALADGHDERALRAAETLVRHLRPPEPPAAPEPPARPETPRGSWWTAAARDARQRIDFARDRRAALRAVETLAAELRSGRPTREPRVSPELAAMLDETLREHGCVPQSGLLGQWRRAEAWAQSRIMETYMVKLGVLSRPALVYARPGEPPAQAAVLAAREKMREWAKKHRRCA